MPRGGKLIDWTPENDARLILTILTVENLHPNCHAVASAFGGAVNALSIQNRLSRLRRKAAEEGIVARPGAAGTAKGGKRTGAGMSGNGAKKSVPAEDDSEPDTTASHSRSSLARTVPIKGQKVLTGRVTKASRNPVKKEIDKDDGVIEVGDHDEVEVLDGEDIDALVKKEEGGDGEEEDEDEE